MEDSYNNAKWAKWRLSKDRSEPEELCFQGAVEHPRLDVVTKEEKTETGSRSCVNASRHTLSSNLSVGEGGERERLLHSQGDFLG